MSNEFNNLAGFDAPAAEATEANATKDMIKEAAKDLIHKIETDANYASIRNSRSKDIIVTKVLGFGKSGSLTDKTQEYLDRAVKEGTVTVLEADSTEVGVVEERDGVLYGTVKRNKGNGKSLYEPPFKKGAEANANGKNNTYRKVTSQPENVGYIIKNVSDKPVEYKTCLYTKNDEGKFVGEEVMKTLAPQEEVAIARPYLTLLALAEEFNLALGNGKIICKIKGSDKDAKSALESPYFSFDSSVGLDINSPEVKELIHEVVEVNGAQKYMVKAEYVELFGNLNNEVEKATAGKRGKAKTNAIKPGQNEVAAHLLRTKLGM